MTGPQTTDKQLPTANPDLGLGPSLWLPHMPETFPSIMSNYLCAGGYYGPLSLTQKVEERITLVDDLESALISGDANHAPNPSPSTITNKIKNHWGHSPSLIVHGWHCGRKCILSGLGSS